MAQCHGTTKKGARCRRDARTGTSFCSIHMDQEIRASEAHNGTEWDTDAIIKVALGFALVGAIFLFRFRR